MPNFVDVTYAQTGDSLKPPIKFIASCLRKENSRSDSF